MGTTRGYRTVFKNGKNVRMGRLVATKILGRELLQHEVVHHADGHKDNDSPENIIICNKQSDHVELHLLLNAKRESGHYSWRRCCYCKKHDDPRNMVLRYNKSHIRGEYFHRLCKTLYTTKHRKETQIPAPTL